MVHKVSHLRLNCVYLFQIFIDFSYNVMSPTILKAFLNSNRIDKLGALVFLIADKKSLRLAIDLFILTYAYDTPFDEGVLKLDESAATKITSTFVSAITNAESLHPAPGLPIIIVYREYVLPQRLFWGKKNDLLNVELLGFLFF